MDTKELLLNESNEMISGIYERLQSLESLDLKSLDKNRTMLLIVDINKGFAKAGALYSDRIEKLINPISNLAKYALNNGIRVKAFTDYHTEEGIEVIKKNSTNGFLEENFILNKEEIDNVIIVGDCTDICIYQLAISLRAEFNRVNKDGEIYVPKKLVDTFDMPMHKANFMNYVFLNSMLDNGVKVIEDIILD